MRGLTKAILIFVVIIAFMVALVFFKEGTGQSGQKGVGGPVGIIAVLVLMAVVRGIYKYDGNETPSNSSNDKLDKS
jgi:hypothetical protein